MNKGVRSKTDGMIVVAVQQNTVLADPPGDSQRRIQTIGGFALANSEPSQTAAEQSNHQNVGAFGFRVKPAKPVHPNNGHHRIPPAPKPKKPPKHTPPPPPPHGKGKGNGGGGTHDTQQTGQHGNSGK